MRLEVKYPIPSTPHCIGMDLTSEMTGGDDAQRKDEEKRRWYMQDTSESFNLRL